MMGPVLVHLRKNEGKGWAIMLKSCFLIGHRETSEEMLPAFVEAVERHIVDFGVSEFVVGNYGGFDSMAARSVIAAKKNHPDITLLLLLPYHPAERPVELPPGFDGSFYPPGLERVPRRFAIVRANRYMIDHTDFLIAGAWHPGNSRELLAYAKKREEKGFLSVTILRKV